MKEDEILKLYPLSLEEYTLYIKHDNLLTDKLSLNQGNRVISPALLKAFDTEIQPYIQSHPESILFATVWIIIIKKLNCIAGHIHFKGKPDNNGLIEVGYRIYDEFQNNGYATRALKLITNWAFCNAGVSSINAYTDTGNIASQKVLAKCGFKFYDSLDKEIEWRLYK